MLIEEFWDLLKMIIEEVINNPDMQLAFGKNVEKRVANMIQ